MDADPKNARTMNFTHNLLSFHASHKLFKKKTNYLVLFQIKVLYSLQSHFVGEKSFINEYQGTCHTGVLKNKLAALLCWIQHLPSQHELFHTKLASIVSESTTELFFIRAQQQILHVFFFWLKLLIKTAFPFSSSDACSEITMLQEQLHTMDNDLC